MGSNEQMIYEQIQSTIESVLDNAYQYQDVQLMNDASNQIIFWEKNYYDADTQSKLFEKWMNLEEFVRNQIKSQLLKTLGTSFTVISNQSSECITKIAEIELRLKTWNDLITTLLNCMLDSNSPIDVLRNSISCLGLICERVDQKVLADYCNEILTAIIQGVRDDNPIVKLASCKALRHALRFSHMIFQKDNERKFIIDRLLECTSHTEKPIRIESLECLTSVAIVHYNFLEHHIQDILNATIRVIENDEDTVAMSAIEFWSTISDVEQRILWSLIQAEENGKSLDRPYFKFINGASIFLIEPLFHCILRSDIGEITEWNLSKAASACLGTMSELIGDAILEKVIPFVQQHISSNETKSNEAACLVFGSSMSGPSIESFYDFGISVCEHLFNFMSCENILVRESAMWALSKLAKHHCYILLNILSQFLNVLAIGLKDAPQVAAFACWTIDEFSENCGTLDENPLEPIVRDIINVLLEAASRHDAIEGNLKVTAYDAIGTIISSTQNQTESFKELGLFFINQLENIAQNYHEGIEDDRLIFACLYYLVEVLDYESAFFADKLVNISLKYLEHPSNNVVDEVFLVLNRLSVTIHEHLLPYFTQLMPHVLRFINDPSMLETFEYSVSFLGNIGRVSKGMIDPYLDEIMDLLLNSLNHPEMTLQSRSKVLICIGDMALASTDCFQKYFENVLGLLKEACDLSVTVNIKSTFSKENEYFNDHLHETIDGDEKIRDDIYALRQSILDLFTGITLSFRSDRQSILEYAYPLVNLIDFYLDDTPTDGLISSSIALLGDIMNTVGQNPKIDWEKRYGQIVKFYEKSENEDISSSASYTNGIIKSIKKKDR